MDKTVCSQISICIPAHNEERFLQGCLDSIRHAAAELNQKVEIVVCLNRCTDRTEEIAVKAGAIVIREDGIGISKVRNKAVRAATGKYIATIDADSRMSRNMLSEITRLLDSEKYIGGGVAVLPERLSVGICLSGLLVALMLARDWVSAGLFWLRKTDFEELGGFDESILTGEDLDFAYRLKALGKKRGSPFKTIMKAKIITSCRKFDHFGDWHMLNPRLVTKLIAGKDKEAADKYYHNFPR